jgi:polysaccharide export outer membrane protein
MPKAGGVVQFVGARAVFFLILSTLPTLVAAQASGPAPTQEQLEAFRNLPPEQQRAVLDAMASRGANGQRADAPLQDPAVSQPALQPAMPLVPPGPPRFEGGATLLLEVTAATSDDTTRNSILESRRDRTHGGNPYRLDSEGRLTLPFLAPIGLKGLTAEEAAQRLNADPRLDGLEFNVSLLPVEPLGIEALKPFGYDVFREVPTTFAPATDIPVPPEYIIGPGDTLILELFGKRSGRYSLVVDREGRLHLPEIGPLVVAGSGFDEVRSEIEQRAGEQMIGVRASVSMGPLRSIRVFIVGDVARPGSYTMSGLSTITHALFTSGGVSQVGSLRKVELKRRGATMRRLDLYDLLLRGDTSNDVSLQSGDVVFVPPIASSVGIAGKVNRAAIYELAGETRVEELLQLAGGLSPDADPRVATLERIDANSQRVVIDVDLTTAAGRSLELRSGDVLIVPQVLEDRASGVTLEGHVVRPGRHAWREGLRLTDVLGRLDALKLNADQRYILIRRERMPARRLEVLSADAVAAFAARGTDADPLLQSRDRIIVFSRQRDRGVELDHLLDELRLQSRDTDAPPVVSVSGRVRAPGRYPLESGMTVSDLVRAGGGLDEAAYGAHAELTRFELANGESRQTEVLTLELQQVLTGSVGADLTLKPYDTLVIKETPDWSEQGTVRILGEVRFPGEYPVRKGETLSSVVARAGGLTDHAFQEGAVFTREEVKQQERQQIETLANRLQSDLALVALQSAQATTNERQSPREALAVGQSLLTQLRGTTPTGRVVIHLGAALERKQSDEDIQLRDRDTLVVPPLRQTVTVIGEAQNPASHVWRRGLSRDDYLRLSGGTSDKADAKRIYVVRADGSVLPRERGSRFFHTSAGSEDIRPGDTIVVPLDTDRMRALPLWTAVTTIIYNLSVAVAAIGSL